MIWHLTPLPPRARVFIVHDDGGMKGMRLGALENHGLHGLRGPEQLRTVGECPAVSGSVRQKVLFKDGTIWTDNRGSWNTLFYGSGNAHLAMSNLERKYPVAK